MHGLIIGQSGTIATALAAQLRKQGWRLLVTTRGEPSLVDGLYKLDLSGNFDLNGLPENIDAVFLLAGITSLQDCETEPELTEWVNVGAPAKIARHFHQLGAHPIMISSNLVFGGSKAFQRPDARYSPQCVYGKQKQKLEEALLSLRPAGAILRITKLAESLLPLLRSWREALVAGKPVDAFSDLYCAPVLVDDVVFLLEQLAEKKISGISQLGGDADLSYIEIAEKLAAHVGASPSLICPTTSDQQIVALVAGPKNTTLSCNSDHERYGLRKRTANQVLEILFHKLVG